MIMIALGANLPGLAGPPMAQLDAALAALDARGITVVRRSRWWRSPAWPDPGEPSFVNGVAVLRTALSPAALMAELHAVEAALGRRRGRANAPRPVDLDLLDFDGVVSAGESGGPVLPHPRMSERAFVLLPVRDVAPGWRHPVSHLDLASMIARLPPHDMTHPIDRTSE